MTAPPIDWFVRILTAVERSGLDWFSNPWKDTGAFMSTWTGDYELRRLEVHWQRTPTVGVVQDDDICTFHILNLTGGAPDASWIAGDYTTCEALFDSFWNSLKNHYLAEIKLSEYVWRADGPAFRPHGTGFSPTLRITPKSVPGSAAGGTMNAPQVALSVTEVTESHYTAYGVGVPGSTPGTGKTQLRNRWGRFYMPGPVTTDMTDGRWDPLTTSAFATATQTLYNGLVASQFVPVMYSPTTGSAWSITEIHVDDIIDVIRSRRYDTPTTRTPKLINPA